MNKHIYIVLYIGFIVITVMSIKSISGYNIPKKKNFWKARQFFDGRGDEINYSPTRITRMYNYPNYEPCVYPLVCDYDALYSNGYDPSWGGYWCGYYGWRYPYWRRYGAWNPCNDFGFDLCRREFNIGFGW